ncbi:hypothetical protein CN138_08915 [Sinorhizobium meliloti]|uniref:hypothetical protein n=1 Tax=Rhizobium meliloti TaxID=382 RepID=UPI000FD26714|nr:hypothetical protein [Sinorhizobium meliloti]RVL48442.1 hypothetical protein CN145_23040 [Sinorhizobium meliloti]RVL72375.1 hypothetical protein CN138_08915 [Sinorhizobium meliloti]
MTASPITAAYLDLSPDIRARAEEIAGNNRPVTWPELLLLVGTAIAGERERCAGIADDHASQCRSKLHKRRSDHDLAVFESAASEAASIASAIRRPLPAAPETEREAME